ncbi:MAG: hypothetical protein DME19_10645 [Verrucomicrobia bacterium]|nr:MAG: hypothetical protein DME19_10645 [Verrucomicrobiota bacterium]
MRQGSGQEAAQDNQQAGDAFGHGTGQEIAHRISKIRTGRPEFKSRIHAAVLRYLLPFAKPEKE